MLRLALILSCFAGLLPEAYAIQFKLDRCAKYFSVLRESHSLPDLSSQYTREAISTLRSFRTNELSEFDFTPSTVAANGTSRSSDRVQQAIARRISAILQEADKRVVDDDERATEFSIIGSVYQGEIQSGSSKRA